MKRYKNIKKWWPVPLTHFNISPIFMILMFEISKLYNTFYTLGVLLKIHQAVADFESSDASPEFLQGGDIDWSSTQVHSQKWGQLFCGSWWSYGFP